MKELNEYTPTELLKMINDAKSNHDKIKKEIINHAIEVDELEVKINNKLNELDAIEKNYIQLIDELNKR